MNNDGVQHCRPQSVVCMYTRCPKCGHQPLPADQAFPAACPACGVIFAKVGQSAAARLPTSETTVRDGWWPRLTEVPDRVTAPTFWMRCLLWVAFGVWGMSLIALDYRDGGMGAAFLHRPLLIFHEAGHIIFMPLGEWFTILGGTLGQLLMPLVLAGALLVTNRDPFGASFGLWFFGVSLLDVAPYMYDALHPQLTLLNGQTGEAGGHDWIFLFSSLGLLAKAQLIGGLIHTLGALVIVGALAWTGWLLRLQYARRT